jgi:HPt (histidine-containing phosphotransfer) domain-containing protein
MSENEKPLVDLKPLRELLGDSPDNIVEILNLFMEHAPPGIADIKELLRKEDWEGLRKRIHSIKSYYGYVGNDPLNQKLNDWEVALHNGQQGVDHHGIFAELEAKTVAIIVRIKQIIKEEFGK